jgi:hypothetical protein
MDRSLVWLGAGSQVGHRGKVIREAAEVVTERVVIDGEPAAEAVIWGKGWHVVLRAERREGNPKETRGPQARSTTERP